jgi:hypothetical protein
VRLPLILAIVSQTSFLAHAPAVGELFWYLALAGLSWSLHQNAYVRDVRARRPALAPALPRLSRHGSAPAGVAER